MTSSVTGWPVWNGKYYYSDWLTGQWMKAGQIWYSRVNLLKTQPEQLPDQLMAANADQFAVQNRNAWLTYIASCYRVIFNKSRFYTLSSHACIYDFSSLVIKYIAR